MAGMIICTLKRVLERKGWSRYRLQKASGISYPTLHALYHGKSKGYSAEVLDKLCRSLHCKPADLLEWLPTRTSRPKKNSHGRLKQY
jgi:putative transcriptional regulator